MIGRFSVKNERKKKGDIPCIEESRLNTCEIKITVQFVITKV